MITTIIFDKKAYKNIEDSAKWAGMQTACLHEALSKESLLGCIFLMGKKPEECVLITDSEESQRIAKRAGVHGLGISAQEEEQILSGADLVLERAEDFPYFDEVDSFNYAYDLLVEDFRKRTVVGKMLDKASKVLENAYAKYSGFRVGAAILTKKGNIYSGCNVENASYGATICAERNAATTAVAEEGPDVRFTAIAIASESDEPAPPCAVCRQFLSEFTGPDAQVYLFSLKTKTIKHYNFSTVMPFTFEL